MNPNELQEIFDGMVSRVTPESSARPALILTQQILTATRREDAAQALLELLGLLAKANSELPRFLCQLWAVACTEDGEAVVLRLAEKLGVLRED